MISEIGEERGRGASTQSRREGQTERGTGASVAGHVAELSEYDGPISDDNEATTAVIYTRVPEDASGGNRNKSIIVAAANGRVPRIATSVRPAQEPRRIAARHASPFRKLVVGNSTTWHNGVIHPGDLAQIQKARVYRRDRKKLAWTARELEL
jgi:hypothetical protein